MFDSATIRLTWVTAVWLVACGPVAARSATVVMPMPPATTVQNSLLDPATALTETAEPATRPAATPLMPTHDTPTRPSPTAAPPTATETPAYPAYQGPPLNRQEVGLQVHIHREDMALIIDHLAALGVGWVKVQVSWKLYQPGPDQFAADRFAELDALVAAAQQHDIAVLLGVAKAPEWSRPTTELDGPPGDYGLYRDFMALLAGRYRGRVAAYELWNEPNLRREWNGFDLSAADFVALVRAGAAGVQAADPGAWLVSGAPATTGIDDGVTAVDDRRFLADALSHGLADGVDAIGVHPYGWANPPDSSAAAPDPAVPSHNDHPSFFFMDTLHDYAALLDAAGYEDQPLWVTEFGWGSFDGLGAAPPDSVAFMRHVDEWQQAIYILRAFELGHKWDRIGPMILWNLNFGPLLGERYAESGFSLLNRDGHPRPAYLALREVPKE